MAYVKNTWQAGDEVTAEKLNNMEGGIEGAEGSCGLVVTAVDGTTLNKTWSEINTAARDGRNVVIISDASAAGIVEPVRAVLYDLTTPESPVYTVTTQASNFVTDAENGYPSVEGEVA